jgi:hypothetical protein
MAKVSTIRVVQIRGRLQVLSSWLMKAKSKLALCAISGASPMNSSSSSTFSWNLGLSARNRSVRPWTASAALGIGRSGLK